MTEYLSKWSHDIGIKKLESELPSPKVLPQKLSSNKVICAFADTFVVVVVVVVIFVFVVFDGVCLGL